MQADVRKPKARKENLVVQDQGNETLVYDTKSHHAHCLNQLAGLVWRHCDGQRTAAELATIAHQQLGAPDDVQIAEVALQELEQAKLLEDYEPSVGPKGVSRREVGRRLGAVAAAFLLAPLVTTIQTQPAMAQASPPPGTTTRSGTTGSPGTTGTATTAAPRTTGTTAAPRTTGTTAAPSTTGTTPAPSTTGTTPAPSTTRPTSSDRNLKQGFAPVDVKGALRCLAAVPVQSWSYKDEPAARHIGPMAQDFAAAFGVGADDKHIHPVDAAGVAFAAIQALYWMVQEKDHDIRELRDELDDVRRRLAADELLVCGSAAV